MDKSVLLFCLATGWGACTTVELPDDSMDNPVFTIDASLGGTTHVWTAGQNDIYLFTSFEPGQNDQPVCAGKLANRFCTECPESFTIEFQRLLVDTIDFSDGYFQVREYPYQPDSQQVALFTANQADAYTDFEWIFNGVETMNGPVATRLSNVSEPVQVELRAKSASGYNSYISRTVTPANTGNFYPAADLVVTKDTQYFHYTAKADLLNNTQLSEISWSNGSDYPSVISDMLDETYSFTLTNSFGNPTVASLTQMTDTQQIVFRTANFSSSVFVTDVYSAPYIPNVKWVDEQGNTWQSMGGQQQPDAYFQVFESEPYKLNEKGQKTRKMRVEFQCTLFNDDGVPLKCAGGGVIAVAFP